MEKVQILQGGSPWETVFPQFDSNETFAGRTGL